MTMTTQDLQQNFDPITYVHTIKKQTLLWKNMKTGSFDKRLQVLSHWSSCAFPDVFVCVCVCVCVCDTVASWLSLEAGGSDGHHTEASVTAGETNPVWKGGKDGFLRDARSASENWQIDGQTDRQRERERERESGREKRRVKPVKYEAWRDVSSDAESVFHQPGECGGGGLVKGGRLRTLSRRDGGAQHLQREEQTL